MAFNYGQEIRKVLKQRGMTVAEFARRINKSRENAYDIFARKSLDTALLSTISQVLDYDFLANKVKSSRTDYANAENKRALESLGLSEPATSYTKIEQELFLVREDLLLMRKEISELRSRISSVENKRKGK